MKIWTKALASIAAALRIQISAGSSSWTDWRNF